MPSAGRTCWIEILVLTVGVAGTAAARAQQNQDPKAQEIVRVAMQTELDASRNDHSHWKYKDVYKSPDQDKVFWVVETSKGSVKKAVQMNGHPLSQGELKEEDAKVAEFVRDSARQEKQHKDNNQDDKRAESMLKMLPDAFLWKVNGEDGKVVRLGFVPNPAFTPPTMESRVFAAMAGEIVVDKEQHRIQTLKGQLTEDVKFGFGLFGRMDKGGTFNIERRELSPGIWQITESHVHINGKALLFKNIGEQEDDVKSEFRSVPQETTLEQAASMLRGEPTEMNAERRCCSMP